MTYIGKSYNGAFFFDAYKGVRIYYMDIYISNYWQESGLIIDSSDEYSFDVEDDDSNSNNNGL